MKANVVLVGIVCLVLGLFGCPDQGQTNSNLPIPQSPPPPPPPADTDRNPPLKEYVCDDFPPLTLALEQTGIVQNLLPTEISYFWNNVLCCDYGYCDNDGPLEAQPDCEEIIVGSVDLGDFNYISLVRFDLDRQITASDIESVSLDLIVIETTSTSMLDVLVYRLDEPWWVECPSGLGKWNFFCSDEFPSATNIGAADLWIWDFDPHWVDVDITETYREWLRGETPNFGLILSPGGFGRASFAGVNHPNQDWHPKLTINAWMEATLKCPLEGSWSSERISGYDFGDWWEEGRCDDKDPQSPRLRHTGVDLHAAANDPVYAVARGTVKYAAADPTWGGYVVLEHPGPWTSTYTHVRPLVYPGERVSRGEEIAAVAPIPEAHLHFQVRLAGYDFVWSFIGRLPEEDCYMGERSPEEPAFPEYFLDPKCLNWE